MGVSVPRLPLTEVKTQSFHIPTGQHSQVAPSNATLVKGRTFRPPCGCLRQNLLLQIVTLVSNQSVTKTQNPGVTRTQSSCVIRTQKSRCDQDPKSRCDQASLIGCDLGLSFSPGSERLFSHWVKAPIFSRPQASWDFITCFVFILFAQIPSICRLRCLFSMSSGGVRFPFKI